MGLSLQGTVFRFDAATGSGRVILDDGALISFDADAFARSGLRLLRPGQRVRVECDDAGTPLLVTIMTLPSPYPPIATS